MQFSRVKCIRVVFFLSVGWSQSWPNHNRWKRARFLRAGHWWIMELAMYLPIVLYKKYFSTQYTYFLNYSFSYIVPYMFVKLCDLHKRLKNWNKNKCIYHIIKCLRLWGFQIESYKINILNFSCISRRFKRMKLSFIRKAALLETSFNLNPA